MVCLLLVKRVRFPNCNEITSSFLFSNLIQISSDLVWAHTVDTKILCNKHHCAGADVIICVVAEYGVCENLRKLEITGVSCRDVYAKRKC